MTIKSLLIWNQGVFQIYLLTKLNRGISGFQVIALEINEKIIFMQNDIVLPVDNLL